MLTPWDLGLAMGLGKILFGMMGLALLLGGSAARAGEPMFGYVYTTDTTPAGKWEVEEWVTDREGQAGGRFHHVHFDTELEFGATDNFQVAFYATAMYDDDSANSVRGKTEGIEIPYDHDPNQPYNQLRFDGTRIELMYRLLSPYTSPVGVAIYVEPEFGSRDAGLEFRGILQKNFLEDQLILAWNTWLEFEYEEGSNLVDPTSTDVPDGSIVRSTMLEHDAGASYRVASNWFVGLELRNHNEYTGHTLNHANQNHTAFFVGPNIHYGGEHWFATLSALRQVGAVSFSDDQRAQMKDNLLYGDEHTTWDGLRLKVGMPF